MPKSTGQKLKILYLMTILLKQTDETHMLTTGELIDKLAGYGISAERKTIYDDIETLRQFGIDIEIGKRVNDDTGKATVSAYHVVNRDFELPELKLLADAVQSSKFITEKKSMQLLKKLEGLSSTYDAGKLRRQIFVQNRVKSMNESIYYSVDAINDAIAEGKKISFQYFYYGIDKKRVLVRDGARDVVSPVVLSWTDENYYLIANSERREGITHYRVDRMLNVRKLDEKRSDAVRDFNLAEYSKKVFGMYGGKEADVKLRAENRLAHAFIDRFGKDIMMIADGDSYFTVTVRVALSPVFYGWLFQFGEQCEVLSPQLVKDEMIERAEKLLAQLR